MTTIALWYHLLIIFGGVVLLECFQPWGNHQLSHGTVLETSEEEYIEYDDLKEAQKTKNAKAKNIIVQCVADSHLELVKECETACLITKKMNRMFVRTGEESLCETLFPSSKIPSLEALNPKRSVVRRKILLYHNFFRSKVQPTASNMLLMTWHAGAAQQAQNYAERCVFLKHNPVEENTVPDLGSCGQNLFVAAQKTPWFFPLKTWFIEYQNFTFGSPNYNFHAVGHYTQMTWATSHKVGCGVAHCPGGPWGQFYNYVCHYCPGGNVDGIIQYPYKPGPKCGDCPKNCISGALCTNSCPLRDFFSNCAELKLLTTDVCPHVNCNATCYCEGRIHKNFPWK